MMISRTFQRVIAYALLLLAFLRVGCMVFAVGPGDFDGWSRAAISLGLGLTLLVLTRKEPND